MKETKKNAVLRVFQTARCSSARYIIGVACSSVSILLSGVPFYATYQIVRIFLEASLNNTAVDVSAAWLWAGITLASIAVGIVLSIIGSFVCHSCAFHALYDLRMRILNHMGRLNLGFFTGGQSGAVQKTMNDNIEKMENIIAHDVPNLIGASLLLVSLSVLLFSINVPLALTIIAALVLAFIIQFSAFGGKRGQKIWTDLNRSSTELDAAFSEYVSGMEEEKIFGKPETAALRLTNLIEKKPKKPNGLPETGYAYLRSLQNDHALCAGFPFGCGMCPAVSESRQSRLDDGTVDVSDCRPGSHQPIDGIGRVWRRPSESGCTDGSD